METTSGSSLVDELIAERLGGAGFGRKTILYKFEKIKRAKDEARKMHPERNIIDLGVGEPDRPADPSIVRVLAEEAGKPGNRFYADNGIAEFQHAAGAFLSKVYGVNIPAPERQIVHGIGTKPILAMLPLCFVNPGDYILTTVPGYPRSSTYNNDNPGKVYSLPLTEENGFLPDLSSIPKDVLAKAKLLYINYPNNPTGQVASRDFFTEVVDFARRNRVFVIHDAAYSALTWGDCAPLSFLSVEGAEEVGVEIHSLSKSFNMTGWRLGFVAGGEKAIKAYATVKDNTDSGQFRAIQKAGIYALGHPELIEMNRERYSRRFDLLVPALASGGFSARKPQASFYCYVKAPKGTADGVEFASAEEAAGFLIREASVSCVPWDDACAALRFSVTFEAETQADEKRVTEELAVRLSRLRLVF